LSFFDYTKSKSQNQRSLLQGFLGKTEIGKLVNKQGTNTFRKMVPTIKRVGIGKEETAIPILIEKLKSNDQ